MFLRLAIVCAVMGSVHSAMKLSSEDIGSKVTDKAQLNFYTYVDKLFKSDKFVPVGTASALSLQATSYSPTGFLEQSVYGHTNGTADTTCSSLTYVSGYAANICFQTDNYAFIFKLTTGATDCTGGVVQYFNDRKCDQYLGSSPLASEQNTCTASTATNGIITNAYEMLQCSTSVSPELLASSVTSGLYPNTKCSGSPFGYINFSPSKCSRLVVNDELTLYTQYTCTSNAPGFAVYTDDACTVAYMTPVTFRSTCSAGNDDAADDLVEDNSAPFFVNPPPSVSTTALPGSQDMPASNNYFCTAMAPTAKPVFAPTAFPTMAVAAPVSFSVEQTLRGIDATTFNANPANAVVLTQTIAGAMSGVVPADILNLEVTGSRRRLKSEPASESARLLQAGSTATATATYTVAPVSVYSASQLQNELTNSVTSGAFTTDLNNNAASNGNSDLVGASSNSFPSDDKKEKVLSTGAIIGIAIGGFAFVVLVIVISWCLCCRKRNDGYSQ